MVTPSPTLPGGNPQERAVDGHYDTDTRPNNRADNGPDLGALVNSYGLSRPFAQSLRAERILYGRADAFRTVVRYLGGHSVSRPGVPDATRRAGDRARAGAAAPGGDPRCATPTPVGPVARCEATPCCFGGAL